MKKKIALAVALIANSVIFAQVFYTQSFESTSGFTLSNIFDNGNNNFCKRDSATNYSFPGIPFFITGADGNFILGAEDSDALEPGAPIDGIVQLDLDPVDISGMIDLELVVALACNAADSSFDDRSQANGDYIDFYANVDGGGFVKFAQFNSAAGASNISTLAHDVNMDGNGGELGELLVVENISDFVLPIPFTGNTVQLRVKFKNDGNDEEIIMDNFRLRQSEGDDVAPTIFSVNVLNQTSIEILFNEDMLAASANQNSHYTGVSNLNNATLQGDMHTVILQYTNPFTIGIPYSLIIFGVQDFSGNAMQVPYQFDFYFNNTLPDLKITEIMYNDPTGADSLEYIEIYNQGSIPAILGGLEIKNAVSLVIPPGTLNPGNFFLAARNATGANIFYGETFVDYSGSLSNTGENIVLTNSFNQLIDSVSYDTKLPWPPGADGHGPSMELAALNFNNDVPSRWVASQTGIGFIGGEAVFGTPGYFAVNNPTMQFVDNDITVNETGINFQFQVAINGANSNSSVVGFAFVEGTATSPDDLEFTGVTPLTFNAFSIDYQTVTIPIVNDVLVEGVEYYIVEISVISNGEAGYRSHLEVIINDDDSQVPLLYINEILSDNVNDTADNAMQYEDWFEIFNPNNFEVDVAGYYISDDPLMPQKDQFPVGFPETIIPANGWLLCWADEDVGQGPLHMNFKFNNMGEYLGLVAPDGSTYLDSISFPALPQDKSYGRFGDGNPDWIVFEVPTPGASNLIVGIEEYLVPFTTTVYPNPATFYVNTDAEAPLYCLDAQGRKVKHFTENKALWIGDLIPGIYILHNDFGFATRFLKH